MRTRLLWQALGLVLLAGFLGLRVWDPVPAQLVRNEIFDQYQVLWPRPESTGEVVIVDLDDASLAEYGQWPWPRTLLAYMVQRLFDMGADVVAFDVVFAEADRLSPAQLAANLDGLSPALRQGLASLPDNDAIFADTIGRHPVVLGQPALHDVPAGSQLEDSGAGTVAELGRDPRPFLQRYEGLVRNLPVLEAAASGIGTVTIALDQDGVARRVPLALVVGERILPALSLEALRLRGGEPSIVIRSGENGVAAVGVAGHAVPTDRQGRIWVRYGASGSIPYIPAADILSGHLDPEAIAGRIVLVGTTAAGLFDIKRTPISPATPGVEVHAHLLETVLTDTYLKRPTTVEGAEIVAMVVASLLVIVLVPSFGALATLGVGSVVMISLALATWYLFAEHLILMDVSFAALASLTIYAVITYLKYVSEESERKTVRTAFAQYLPPAVVERLASHPEQLRLGGEARELSILFSDVRGFTSISETMAPEELATFVNRILNALTGAVLDNRGTVDKYIGDAVMALWNAPLDDAEHGRNACRGALAMVKAIEMLDHELAAALPPGAVAHRIAVGVGVNTGIAAVGNFGSDYRFDYTALGDTVNLAARLESLCPIYGCPAIVSEQTVAEAPEFATLEIDTVQVKGRKEAVRIFALVGDEQLASTAAYQRLREVHSTLLKELALNDVARATLSLDTARKLAGTLPIQGIYDRYDKRIAEMDQHARVAAPEEA